MSWDEIRNAARRVVHDTFRLACVYRAPNKAPRDIHARLHTKLRVFGDLDREGYAQMLEDVNYVFLDDAEGPFVENATITFAATGQKFNVTWVAPNTDGSGYRKAEVTPDVN